MIKEGDGPRNISCITGSTGFHRFYKVQNPNLAEPRGTLRNLAEP